MNLDKERKECVADLRNCWLCMDAVFHLYKKGKMSIEDFRTRLDMELKRGEIALSELNKLGM